EEQPQTIALILSRLPPALASRVLGGLPSTKQLEVVRRVATLKETAPDVLREVELCLRDRMVQAKQHGLEGTGGVSSAAGLLSEMDRQTNQALLEGLARQDADLASRIHRLTYVFDDLLNLDRDAARSVFPRIDCAKWALALQGASDPLRSKIVGC